jgi:hypothetical protein
MIKRSSSNDRKVQGYLKPKTYTNFKAFVGSEEMTDSEGVNYILTKFFNTLSPEQKQSYLSRSRGKNSF